MGNNITLVDVDNMKLCKLSEHPDTRPRLDGMQTDKSKYHSVVQGIKSFDERKDAQGTDAFDISDAKGNDPFVLSEAIRRCNAGELPHFALALRAVLTHSLISYPPSAFCIFNSTCDDDQR